MTAVIVWFLMVLTGPRMDEGGPIAHPAYLSSFHSKAECEKRSLEVVKKRTLPGQSTTYQCIKSNDHAGDYPGDCSTRLANRRGLRGRRPLDTTWLCCRDLILRPRQQLRQLDDSGCGAPDHHPICICFRLRGRRISSASEANVRRGN